MLVVSPGAHTKGCFLFAVLFHCACSRVLLLFRLVGHQNNGVSVHCRATGKYIERRAKNDDEGSLQTEATVRKRRGHAGATAAATGAQLQRTHALHPNEGSHPSKGERDDKKDGLQQSALNRMTSEMRRPAERLHRATADAPSAE